MTRATNRENFEAWFGVPLEAMMEDENSGFVLVMVTFPIFERYLRAKSRCEPNTPPFNQAILSVLPELEHEARANSFWAIYRHGILHHVALSRESHGLSLVKPIVEVWPNGKVWMNPILFAQRVLDAIRNNFALFEAGVPLPQAQQIVEQLPGVPPGVTYWATGMPPGSGRR
jgi:hypothetical protein